MIIYFNYMKKYIYTHFPSILTKEMAKIQPEIVWIGWTITNRIIQYFFFIKENCGFKLLCDGFYSTTNSAWSNFETIHDIEQIIIQRRVWNLKTINGFSYINLEFRVENLRLDWCISGDLIHYLSIEIIIKYWNLVHFNLCY